MDRIRVDQDNVFGTLFLWLQLFQLFDLSEIFYFAEMAMRVACMEDQQIHGFIDCVEHPFELLGVYFAQSSVQTLT